MTKVKHIRIELNRGMSVKSTRIEEYNVIGENEEYIVLDDLRFSTLRKEVKKDKDWDAALDKCSISDHSSDATMERILCFMSVSVYTTKSLKVIENKINKEINKYVKDKCSGYSLGEKVNIRLSEDE